MAKLLHISSSPRGDRSASLTVAKTFLEFYQTVHPGDQIETLDLWHADLPEFDGETINGKYAILHGKEFTPEQETAWKAVVALAAHFKSADKFVISLPMWNFGIPYKLKHYIDVLLQPTLTFSHSPEKGYIGLVNAKPLALIYARGGAYGTDSEEDEQSGYMRKAMSFIGFTDIKEIFVQPTLEKSEAVENGKKAAKEIAAKF